MVYTGDRFQPFSISPDCTSRIGPPPVYPSCSRPQVLGILVFSSYRMRIGLSYGYQASVTCRVADPFPYWFHINTARLLSHIRNPTLEVDRKRVLELFSYAIPYFFTTRIATSTHRGAKPRSRTLERSPSLISHARHSIASKFVPSHCVSTWSMSWIFESR